MSCEQTGPRLETLAARIGLGTIKRCPNGCIHFAVGMNQFRIGESQFWGLVDMIYESARTVASRPPKRKPQLLS